MESRFLAGARAVKLALIAAALVVLPVVATWAAKPKSVIGSSTTDQGFAAKEKGDGLEPTSKRAQLYPRSNYVWPYATGPNYGDVDAARRNDAGVVHTRVGSFDLSRGTPAFPSELRGANRLGQVPAQHFLLQVDPVAFGDGSFDRIRESITSQGGTLLEQMPVGAFVARLTVGAFDTIRSMPGVLALEPYHPAFKLTPTIGRVPLSDPVRAVSDVYRLEASVFFGENVAAVAAQLSEIGANVVSLQGDAVIFEIHRTKLAQVAAIDAISVVNESVPVFVKGEESSSTVQSGAGANNTPYTDVGIDGGGNGLASGQILMVLDSGIQVDAGDLSDTATNAGTIGVAHRKVILYQTTVAFSGGGDLLGCDAPASGAFTHGHVVSGTALGNGTRVPASYGAGWVKTDGNGVAWDMDGVAPRAKLIAYDAESTPGLLGCGDPLTGGLSVGNVFSRNAAGQGDDTGSLKASYDQGARVANFSWGTSGLPSYSTNARRIDEFLFDYKDAMVFVSAGNEGTDLNIDGVPDPNTISDPASAKNAIVVGASTNANGASGLTRAGFSSVGPATQGNTRIAPLLMAPGADNGGTGFASEFACRSGDNDQTNPVDCQVSSGAQGTSFSSPAAAGTALVIRDYFAQGFYPDGTASNASNASDKVANISGALVKAVLVGSARFMTGGGLDAQYRHNNEQGYGRIQLNNVLPLVSAPTAIGLVVCDGGIAGGICNTGSVDGTIGPGLGSETYSLQVVDNTQNLVVSLAWIEDANEATANNLNLTVTSPTGKVYYGNYFTDDNNRTGVLDAGENCDYGPTNPYPNNSTNKVDAGPWNLPTCANSVRDSVNPTEAVFIGADPNGDGAVDNPGTGQNEGADNMIELGTWTVEVSTPGTALAQGYAIAMAGPVGIGSSTRVERIRDGQLAAGNFVCNDSARVTVNEIAEGSDPAGGLTTGEVASRLTVQVVDKGVDNTFGTGDDVVVDSETNLSLTDTDGAGPGLKFQSTNLVLTTGTTPDPGNGALDIQSGQQIRVRYQDETSGSPDPNKLRTSQAVVDCRPSISTGGVVFGQFGLDTFTLVSGGCEKDARGYFTFGFPDRYMDAGELVGYRIAFISTETVDLEDVEVSLKPVVADADSPVTCLAGSTSCADPDRLNNAVSTDITVLDTPKQIGRVPAGAVLSANFNLQLAASISGTPDVEMVLGVSAKKSGKAVNGYAISRHKLDVDEFSLFYSTDFPSGGNENRDYNDNETLENPSSNAKDFLKDYRFENLSGGRAWSALNINGKNASISAPWNFDANSGNFVSGVYNATTPALANGTAGITIAQWGEDKNFNGVLDASVGEDRDGTAGILDRSWSTTGGCGWQTRTAATGGVWHSGRIGGTSGTTCNGAGNSFGRCQQIEVIPGTTGQSIWWEIMLSPTVDKVNTCVTGAETNCGGRIDAPGSPVFRVEFLNFAWNTLMDLPDANAYFGWSIDSDKKNNDTYDILNDGLFNLVGGAQGSVSGGNAPLTDGFPVFANIATCEKSPNWTPANNENRCGGLLTGALCNDKNGVPQDSNCSRQSINGTLGGNRQANNNCLFDSPSEANQVFALPQPLDDDAEQGWCARNDALNNIDRSFRCTVAAQSEQCSTKVDEHLTGVCTVDAGTAVDAFVGLNGPIRNFSIESANGIDMRFTTLEDVFGDSGDQFQVGFSMINLESGTSTAAVGGFGVAIDDVVMEWREFRQDKDSTVCGASGPCATIELQTTNFFEGNARIDVTALEQSPWKAGQLANNCNLDRVCANNAAQSCVQLSECSTCSNNASRHCSDNPGCWVCSNNPAQSCEVNADCGTGNTCSNTAVCNVSLCNEDYTDAGDDQDCNDNGTQDIVVGLTSESESKFCSNAPTVKCQNTNDCTAPGICAIRAEPLALDRTVSNPSVWKGSIPISNSFNADGVVYIAQSGTDAPTVRASYIDRDDGSGNVCKTSSTGLIAEETLGTVETATSVLASTGRIAVENVRITDNGDGDGFADTNETVTVFVTLRNRTGIALDNVSATLNTSSSRIECISVSTTTFGSLANNQAAENPIGFTFKVGNVSRTAVTDDFNARFSLAVRALQLDGSSRPLEFSLPLDLNASGGGTLATFQEQFDGAGLVGWTAGKFNVAQGSLAASNGYRCQYNDPNALNSNAPGRADCKIGYGNPLADLVDWHQHTPSTAGNQRSFTGNNSAHWGTHSGATPALDGTRFSQLTSLEQDGTVALAANATSILSFAHQISLLDWRGSNTPFLEAADRAVVHVRLANGGTGFGNWIKVYPYENQYEHQGTDNFANCTFDPIDDGNNEDSYFDPTDPNRRLGPSSTCFPEFIFSWQGDTDHRNQTNLRKVGGAADSLDANGEPLGLAGSGLNPRGVWIKPKFNLGEFRAREIKLRFVTTSIGVSTIVTTPTFFNNEPNHVEDDGWYIDDVQITNSLVTGNPPVPAPATLTVDNNANSGLPGCAACTAITPSLVATPTTTAAPGQPVQLDASASTADSCPNGTLQFQYWIDANGNSIVGDAGDTLLRDWTDDSGYLDAPMSGPVRYALKVRCSSTPNCDSASNTAVTPVNVNCPSSGTLSGRFNGAIGFSNKTTVSWTTSQGFDAIQGDLNTLRSSGGNFNGAVNTCLQNNGTGTSLNDAATPAAGAGFYYLLRPTSGGAGGCNAGSPSYGTGNAKEAAGRDTEIAADPDACP
ncbi:MAG TPA: hypothetical protein VF139_14050 [Candidatus Polarisedimenticolaceae bacterium]